MRLFRWIFSTGIGRRVVLRLTAAAALTLIASPLPAGKYNRTLSIGDGAPTWSDLQGTDAMSHSLSDLREKDVVVICFTCNSCPYAVDYEDRLVALQKKLDAAGASVALVAINANAGEAEDLEHMQTRAAEKEFQFLSLRDESQDVARAYGAVYTPEFFVLNRDRRIVYMGAMDDKTKAEDVQVRYVELAIEAAIKGESPETSETAARGCTIRFKSTR